MTDLAFRSVDPMTQAEFARWVEKVPASDLHHYELLDGFVVMEPPAGWPHGRIGILVSSRIENFLQQKPLGLLFDASQGFDLPSGDTVEPDVAFVSNDRCADVPQPVRGFLPVVPDLVVEILSPSTRRIDREQKRRIYERNGVREYVLVDPVTSSFEVYRQSDQGFAESSSIPAGGRFVSDTVPGFEIEVSDVFYHG